MRKMKDLLELLKFLDEQLDSFIIETDRNYVSGCFTLLIRPDETELLQFEDLAEIREFCDDLAINTDRDGKLYLALSFCQEDKKGTEE